MRYIGSKESLTQMIQDFLFKNNLTNPNFVFFDAFCGMGSVANFLQNDFHIIINDILKSCTIYTHARLLSGSISFKELGFDPIDFLNENAVEEHGFFYYNYSPGGSQRKYFTERNAGKIDYFRSHIEEWYINNTIDHEQYVYLLGCLIEAVSNVSNTAGVYGAFLKQWDKRALKEIHIKHLESSQRLIAKPVIYNERIENIISSVECDILYLDPPYTQNQYGTQYHLLETLILQDNPPLSKITGSRPTTPFRSNWSKDISCHILLDEIIAKTKARYILLSYNNDGFMSKDYIESILKRYGNPETYQCLTIDYKKYNNFKCREREGHVEYLFFIEKRTDTVVTYESPLNYQGNKINMIKDITDLLPVNLDVFIDAFGGGFNVGINVDAKQIIYNDINTFVQNLILSFYRFDTYSYIKYIKKTIKDYCLSIGNKDSYLRLRSEYNSTPIGKRDPRMLYTLILFGFQQQIRFNSSLYFNNPVGSRHFNDKIMAKLISFSRKIRERNIIFQNVDYKNFEQYISNNSIFYFDPPYLNTTGAYNDGKRGFEGWSKEQELILFKYLDYLNSKSAKFILSYIYDDNVVNWANDNQYEIFIVSNQGKYNKRREILVRNYHL